MKVGDLVIYDSMFNNVNDWRVYVTSQDKKSPGLVIKKLFSESSLQTLFEVRWKNGIISIEDSQSLLIFRGDIFNEKEI